MNLGQPVPPRFLSTLVPSVLWCCWLGGRKGTQHVKNWVVRYWRGYLSEARCNWLAYGPADATATPSVLAPVKSRMVYLSAASLVTWLYWKKAVKRCSSRSSSFSNCSGTELLCKSGIGFFMGRMPFLSPNKQCQSTHVNSQHWFQSEKSRTVVILSSSTTGLTRDEVNMANTSLAYLMYFSGVSPGLQRTPNAHQRKTLGFIS